MARDTGRVAWFNNAKGYGFVRRETSGPDVFVHYSAIDQEGYKSLREGMRVEYDIVSGPQGKPQADKVKRIEEAT